METRYPDSKNGNSIQDGLEFQDFVTDLLAEHGIAVQCYSSKKYQLNRGESRNGIEIKLDNRCTETGRLSIEIAEKTNAAQTEWIPSGILRGDNTWLYVQGNKEVLFVFAKSTLRLLYGARQQRGYREGQELTIKKFYLPLSDARKYAALVIDVYSNQ